MNEQWRCVANPTSHNHKCDNQPSWLKQLARSHGSDDAWNSDGVQEVKIWQQIKADLAETEERPYCGSLDAVFRFRLHALG